MFEDNSNLFDSRSSTASNQRQFNSLNSDRSGVSKVESQLELEDINIHERRMRNGLKVGLKGMQELVASGVSMPAEEHKE